MYDQETGSCLTDKYALRATGKEVKHWQRWVRAANHEVQNMYRFMNHYMYLHILAAILLSYYMNFLHRRHNTNIWVNS